MSMRERVARAIMAHMFPEYGQSAFDEFDEYLRAKYLECADAVLDALSHPTPEMEKALCTVMSDGGLYFHHPDDGDLDDYERHCFKTLRAAFVAAIRKAGER